MTKTIMRSYMSSVFKRSQGSRIVHAPSLIVGVQYIISVWYRYKKPSNPILATFIGYGNSLSTLESKIPPLLMTPQDRFLFFDHNGTTIALPIEKRAVWMDCKREFGNHERITRKRVTFQYDPSFFSTTTAKHINKVDKKAKELQEKRLARYKKNEKRDSEKLARLAKQGIDFKNPLPLDLSSYFDDDLIAHYGLKDYDPSYISNIANYVMTISSADKDGIFISDTILDDGNYNSSEVLQWSKTIESYLKLTESQKYMLSKDPASKNVLSYIKNLISRMTDNEMRDELIGYIELDDFVFKSRTTEYKLENPVMKLSLILMYCHHTPNGMLKLLEWKKGRDTGDISSPFTIRIDYKFKDVIKELTKI